VRDTYGLLPPVIAQNYEREAMVDNQLEAAVGIYRALQAMDPRLDLVFVTDRADPEYGVVPGRWHVVRHNDKPAPDTYIPITTRDGGFREPDSGVIAEMQDRDTWVHGTPDLETKRSVDKKTDPLFLEQTRDAIAEDVRATFRVAGDGGMEKRKWGRGK